jgi:glucose/arabinose dehydrogenase
MASAREIITWSKPASNHNGGMIMFGPDGYLYITAGDGGVQFDGNGNARDTNALLGKIMRIDVEDSGESHNPSGCDGCPTYGPFNYTIPKDNPFIDNPAFAPEIWAWGFRNPWRAAFDPPTNRLYVGDVGQGSYEEVTVVEGGGGDYGWSMLEGLHCTPSAQYAGFDPDCDDSAPPGGTTKLGQIQPLAELSAGSGAHSVIGLSVYRSCQVPAWDGRYFFSDHYTTNIHALNWDGDTVDNLGNVFGGLTDSPTGNGWNAWGDVFVTSVEESGGFVEDGHVWRIVPVQ